MVGLLAFCLLVVQATAMRSADPCSPYPCGPNTDCNVSSLGVAVCRCQSGFFPKPDTITGCGPQCTRDDECGNLQQCSASRCVNICESGTCGINANCDARNRRAICSCPSGYGGDPFTRCSPQSSSVDSRILSNGGHSSSASSFSSNRPVSASAFSSSSSSSNFGNGNGNGGGVRGSSSSGGDPCAGFSCGNNAECTMRSSRAVCSCRAGYEGDPYNGCRRSECLDSIDCASDKVCLHNRCISPCSTSCGVDAECSVRNHITVCTCPSGFTGDPFVSCTRSTSSGVNTRAGNDFDFCSPTPCGRNTKCRVQNSRAVCSCLDGYFGNPIDECRHECESDAECGGDKSCLNYRCDDPCTSCGTYADCRVSNHRAICSCPENFLGDPFSRCYPECTQHEDCSSSQACFSLKCVNPCTGACGENADCRVENHKAICSCPKGYTGHPFDRCRPFDKSDLCNPDPCGSNAMCKPGTDRSGNDRPVCFCRAGFLGDPLVSCNRGECVDHADCSANKACYGYKCVDPCVSTTSRSGAVCGSNARCDARNHGAVCSCPVGYEGDPLSDCRVSFTRG